MTLFGLKSQIRIIKIENLYAKDGNIKTKASKLLISQTSSLELTSAPSLTSSEQVAVWPLVALRCNGVRSH